MRSKDTSLCEIHENAKCRVPNNMIEICVVNSMDYVMCKGMESLEEHDEQAKGNEVRKMRTNVKSWSQDVQCQWIWMSWAMTMNDKAEETQLWTPNERKWLKMSEWVCTTTPNTRTKGRWRHRMPSKTMAPNAKMKKMMTLNVKLMTWLWTPKTDESGSR